METASQPTEASVSIDVSLLNSLMNLAGELVLCRNQLLQAINSDDRRLLETTGQHIDLVTTFIYTPSKRHIRSGYIRRISISRGLYYSSCPQD